MILRSTSASPFARKVRIAAEVLGIADQIEIVPADATDPDDNIRGQNPLGKIPTLIKADGEALYDSAVIIEYLDDLAGGSILIPKGANRFTVLTQAALADGILDAAILKIYEQRWRESATHSTRWLSHQTGKIERGLAEFEASAGRLVDVDVASIGLACVLGYLDLRFGGVWRNERKRLAIWLDEFAMRVPAFEATRYKDAA